MRILALASFPERMAATRFRIAAYAPALRARGIDVDLVPWLDDATAAVLYSGAGRAQRVRAGLAGLGRQLRALGARGRYDALWVQREAMMAGPPVIEALGMAGAGLPLVLDYDDAIWIAQGGPLRRVLKCAWKTDWTIRRAAHVIAGSSRLGAHAHALGADVTVLPTVVPAAAWTPLPCRQDGGFASPGAPPVVGWIGTHSTAPQLDLVLPALRRLRGEGVPFQFRVVGAGQDVHFEGLSAVRRPWREDLELHDFQSLDVGLAPMHATEWHEGKCGFKQVQYMAVGVPHVTSLVGGARDFVEHERNALVAASAEDWYQSLRRLLHDRALRASLSAAGRGLVEASLCTERQGDALADLFARVVAQRARRSRG